MPSRNLYDKSPDQQTSEVGLRMRASEDIYVLLNDWEAGGTSAVFTIYVNPLTVWLWLGGLVLTFGTLICVWPHPVRREETVAASAGAPVEAAA